MRSESSSAVSHRPGKSIRLRSTVLSPAWLNAATLIVSIPALSTRETATALSASLARKKEAEEQAAKTLVLLVKQRSGRNKERRSLLWRILQWTQNAYRSLKEMLYITARGSIILLYVSPIALLWPMEYLWHHGRAAAAAALLLIRSGNSSSRHYTDGPQLLFHNGYSCYDWTWRYARWSITQLGPAFCKLAQWMATRRDLFPRTMCDELSQLQDRGIPHARHYTIAACQDEFGNDIWNDLVLFDDETNNTDQPHQQHHRQQQQQRNMNIIGCGSAAQVYRGRYKGQKVAIKVLHPRLYERLVADLQLARAFANILHQFVPMLNLPQAVSNFGSMLLAQTDLRAEAANLQTFHENFGQEAFVRVPQPILVGETVLIEELMEDARPMTEYIAQHQYHNISRDSSSLSSSSSSSQAMTEQQNSPKIRKELAGPLLRAFLKMIFLDNFVHCDLHSGNILVQELSMDEMQRDASQASVWDRTSARLVEYWNGTDADYDIDHDHTKLRRRIVLLDAGIVVRLDANDLRNLRDLFKAVILNDGATAGTLMVERSRDPSRCIRVTEFADKVEALVSEFHDNRRTGLTLGAVRIGNLLTRVLDLCHEHCVEIDPNMASIVVSTLVLEGLGRSLDPDLNLIDFAVPFVLGRGKM
jgi:aarF domain-containing kinase